MKLSEVTSYNLKSQAILNESWDVLTEAQRKHIGLWESRVWPLMEELNTLLEAELTPDQIQQIFSNAEKVSIEQGTGLTALGKAGKVTAEVTGKMKAEIEKLLKNAQNSGPVKNFDAQFDKLKAQLTKQLSKSPGGQKILQGVDKWKGFATDNPAKSAFVIAAMTSVLAFASGGIMSGAAIGFFIKLANNTIKGDKLSTAIAKGAKGAAIGAVAGGIGGLMKELGADEISIETPADEATPAKITTDITSDEVADAAEVDDPQEVADSMPDLQSAKDAYAEQIASSMDNDIPYEMIEKISDTLVVEGNYPEGPYTMKLPDGCSFLRGNIFLAPDEAEAWNQFRQGKDMSQLLGKEGTDWLKQNVDGADEIISGQEAEYAAQQAEIEKDNILPKDEVDALSDKELSTRMQELKASPDFDPEGESDVSREYRQLNRELNSRKFDFGYDYSDKQPVLDDIEESLWREFEMYEAGFADMMKKAGQSAKNIGKAAAKGMGKAADKAGAAAATAASKGLGAVKKGAAAAGKEIGQKVTVRKLNAMWKKMGEPTDTGSIANLLADAGMSDEQIGTVGSQNKVDLKPSAAPTGQVDKDKDGKDDATGEPIKKGPAVKDGPIEKGTIQNKGGKDYRWEGALWVDVKTNKALGVQASFDMGLPNPKLQPIIDAAKKDPELAKLIKAQITAKGVKAGTAGAAKAAQAGVKGTEVPKTA